MDPDEAPGTVLDKPETSAPEGTTDTLDYRKSYEELRPQFTRTTQELAALRAWQEAVKSDPDKQREFLAELGYEFEEEAPADPQPGDDLRAEIDALKAQNEDLQAWRDGLTQQQQIDALVQAANAEFKELGLDPNAPDAADNAEVVEWIETRALAMPRREDGTVDIKGAHAQFEALRTKLLAQQTKPKKAPAPPSNGMAGTQVPDLDDDGQRQAWMAARLTQLASG